MKKPGRPPLDDQSESVQVCVTLPAKKYDDLYQQAKQQRLKGVPELIRLRLDQNSQQ